MRQLSQLFTLFFIFVHLRTVAQSDIQQDWRVDPLLKQVYVKRPDLKMFGRKDGKGGYVNMAVLNESTRKLKWFTCHGVAFDSVHLLDDEYYQIIAGTLDPFTFYRNYCYENLFHIEQAEILYRVNGKAALRDTTHNNRIVFNSISVKSAQSTLQKLIAMEGLMKKVCLQLRLFDSRTPRELAINRKDSSLIRQGLAGIMTRKVDSTEYFNTDPFSSAAKIVLHRQSPDRLFVYNREGTVMDSVPLKPGKYASLLQEKEDVFLLYRGWLELQWQQVVDRKRQYAAWQRKLDSSLYRSASWEQSKRQLQNVAVNLQQEQMSIDDKISGLIIPEEKYVAKLVADFYRSETSEISYLQGLGFAYTISYIRGQKMYELTDHRGNVMTVVSDKKNGLDENEDGVIEYYNAEVVRANDYYPFGMLQPGRAYNAGNKYRYGYNGKENDNEVKGEGNQQDYGMRIYDPRIAKFLSIDPISVKYPELTPYQFASNTPIMGVDLDGLEIMVTINSVFRKNTDIKVVGAIDIKYKVLNLSKNAYTLEMFNADKSILQERFSRMLTGEGSYIYGDPFRNGKPVKTQSEIKMYNIAGDMKVNFSMELIDNINQVKKGDYVFLIVDDINSKNAVDEVGHGDNSGNVAAVEASGFIEQATLKYKMVMLHEVGHNLSLTHVNDNTNFMYGYVIDKALRSNSSQKGDLLGGVGINSNTKVGKYQYSKNFDTRLRISEFIKENNITVSRHNALKTSSDKPTMNVDTKKQ